MDPDTYTMPKKLPQLDPSQLKVPQKKKKYVFRQTV
jgi:hypothetical protein